MIVEQTIEMRRARMLKFKEGSTEPPDESEGVPASHILLNKSLQFELNKAQQAILRLEAENTSLQLTVDSLNERLAKMRGVPIFNNKNFLGDDPDTCYRKCLALLCRRYQIRPAEVLGRGQSPTVVRPRQILMWLLRKNTTLAFPQIGSMVMGRDHSTVQKTVAKLELRRGRDAAFCAELDSLNRDWPQEQVP